MSLTEVTKKASNRFDQERLEHPVSLSSIMTEGLLTEKQAHNRSGKEFMMAADVRTSFDYDLNYGLH